MNRKTIATATAPTDSAPAWPLIMLSPNDDAAYNSEMAALLEERILGHLWSHGEASTLHGFSRAALQELANEVASFATGQNGFDLTGPSAGILDALEARTATAPAPSRPTPS